MGGVSKGRFQTLERIFEKQPDKATRSVLNTGEDKYLFFLQELIVRTF